jgi:hypothetical protein
LSDFDDAPNNEVCSVGGAEDIVATVRYVSIPLFNVQKGELDCNQLDTEQQ